MGSTDKRQRAKNTTDKTRKKLLSTSRKKKLTDYRHGPTLSIFIFRKMRSEERFVFFLVYEVIALKVTIEFPVIFLLFSRKSAGSFRRTIFATRADETSRSNISTTLFVHTVQPCQPHEWNNKSDRESFPKRRRSRNRTPP